MMRPVSSDRATSDPATSPTGTTSAEPTRAAVLLPFYRGQGGEPRLILIERGPHGTHGGQIALPGGKHEITDATMRDTAVRETCEELGIEARTFEVLDELPTLRTRSTGFQVWPFVGRLLTVPTHWQPRPGEVARVLDLAVADLADPDLHGTEEMEFTSWNTRITVPVWRVGGYPIWGLTLRILEPVLPRVLAGEWAV